MNKFWSTLVLVVALIAFLAFGVGISYLQYRAAFQFGNLTGRVQGLEDRVADLETESRTLCSTILRLSEVDSDLISIGTAEDPEEIEPLLDKIYSTQAYCRSGVFVSIDLRQTPGSRITFQETEVTSHLRSFLPLGEDFEIVLVNERGSISVNPGSFVERGDLIKVWVSSEKPELTAFYDEATGLAISILHVDGSIEVSVYE